MLKDVLYNSKVLNGLFTESDFSFLNEADSEFVELDEELRKQKTNREHIINFINNFDDLSNSNSASILDETQEIFALVNTNINNIYKLQEQFKQLEKMIVELLVDTENGNSVDTQAIFEVQTKINSYSNMYKDIKDTISVNNVKINNFLHKINVPPYGKIANREVIINLDKVSSIENLDEDIQDNLTLIISENKKKVFLPYTKEEIVGFMKKYPNEYPNAKEVIDQEFIVPIFTYSKHPTLARFREAYALIRDREMKTIMDAFKYAIDLMFKYELNPAIIAACKSEKQLNDYLQCLESGRLDDFKYFEIKYEVTPFTVKNS